MKISCFGLISIIFQWRNHRKALQAWSKYRTVLALLLQDITCKYLLCMLCLQSYGVAVQQLPTPDLQDKVDQQVASGSYQYLHSFDDSRLIAGYGRYPGTPCILSGHFLYSLFIFTTGRKCALLHTQFIQGLWRMRSRYLVQSGTN